jgi:Ca2+-transporting ATPase
MWLSIVVTGILLIAGGLFQLATGFLGGSTPAEIGTVFFAAFIFVAVWNGINCRALDGKMPPFFRGNPTFFVVTAFIVAVQVLIVQYGGVFFETVPLSLELWVRTGVASASVLVVGALLRFGYRVHNVYLSRK